MAVVRWVTTSFKMDWCAVEMMELVSPTKVAVRISVTMICQVRHLIWHVEKNHNDSKTHNGCAVAHSAFALGRLISHCACFVVCICLVRCLWSSFLILLFRLTSRNSFYLRLQWLPAWSVNHGYILCSGNYFKKDVLSLTMLWSFLLRIQVIFIKLLSVCELVQFLSR